MLTLSFSQHRYINYAHVRLVWTEPKSTRFVHHRWSCYIGRGLCKSQLQWESVPGFKFYYWFFLCPVGTIGRKKRKTLELSNRHRLRCSVESGKVSTSSQHSVQVHITQTLHPFLQSHPCVLAEDFWSWRDILTSTHTGCGVAWAGMLVFDSLVFSMTVYKSIVLPRPNRLNILDILLRDGELYLPGNSFLLINIQGGIYFG